MTILFLFSIVLPHDDKPCPIDAQWVGKRKATEQARMVLVTHRDALVTLWRSREGREEIPKVDFRKHFLVAIFPEGKWTGARAGATTNGKAVLVTLVLDEDLAPPICYNPLAVFILFPRTTLPIRVKTRVSECGGINKGRDADLGELKTVCPYPNECHFFCILKVGRCGGCAKEIPFDCHRFCIACAGKALCPLCGRGR